jgi:hypothetical protein
MATPTSLPSSLPCASIPLNASTWPDAQASASPPSPVAPHAPTAIKLAGTSVATPSASHLPGTRRQALSLPRHELAQRFTGAEPAVLDELLVQLSHHVPEVTDTLACERLGRAQQQAYAALLDRTLALSDHAEVRNAQRHLVRLREILADVAEQFDARGWGWLRRKSARAKLHGARDEIQNLKHLLLQAHTALDEVRQGLAQAESEMSPLRVQVMAQVLLVEVLTPHLKPEHQPALLARGLSLGQTASQIQQQSLLTQQTSQGISTLAAHLHDAVWVQLPAWLSTVAALPEGDISDTQRYLIQNSAQSFLQHLS